MSTQACGRRSGWVTFAAIAMFAIGFVRIISAFTYFDNANGVNDLTNAVDNVPDDASVSDALGDVSSAAQIARVDHAIHAHGT